MANRYLRATGNWNGPVWAAFADGTAGTAATPTASDNVYIAANFTVTLTENSECSQVTHTDGRLNLSSYTLTVKHSGLEGTARFQSSGSTARTIDLGSGSLVLGELSASPRALFELVGSNLTFIAGTSTIIFNSNNYGLSFDAKLFINSHVFNDMVINLGSGTGPSEVSIYGSPTFRSLIIQSKNSAAHTVNFEGNGGTEPTPINISKFVAIGSSNDNRLTLDIGNSAADNIINIADGGTSYGQYVTSYVDVSNNSNVPKYLGSQSSDPNGFGWLLQDPPKISTLVDPLTTAPGSNSNWVVSGTVTQITSGVDGGGYGTTSSGNIVSTNTFDLVGSEVIFEIQEQIANVRIESAAGVYLEQSPGGFFEITHTTLYGDSYYDINSQSVPKFIKVSLPISTRILKVDCSADGETWVNMITSPAASVEELVAYRSMRMLATLSSGSFPITYSGKIGSINPSLAPKSSGNFLPFFMP